MKSLRRMCAVAALTCVCAISICAGEMSAGIANPPPPQPATATSADTPTLLEIEVPDETSEGVIQTVWTLLQSMLSGLGR